MAARPDDLTGHELLAKSEAGLGNFARAAAAQARLTAVKGADATALDHVTAAELMIQATGGQVSPEAEAQLMAALRADPRNGAARFYSGLMMAQVARPDQAFALWRPLLEEGPADAPWIAPIRASIQQLADAAGVNYTLPDTTGPDAKGPDAAALSAAGEMSAEDRQAMIKGMVGQLEARLTTEGGSAEEWVKLVTSLGVLGETARQKAAYDAGLKALAADAAGLQALQQAGAAAGLTP